MRIWLLAKVLALCSCGLLTTRRVAYLEQATGHATPDQVAQEFGPPMIERALEDGGTVWVYRYTGVSMAMMLDVSDVWCLEYVLTFDAEKILRRWERRDCQGQKPSLPHSGSGSSYAPQPSPNNLSLEILTGSPARSDGDRGFA